MAQRKNIWALAAEMGSKFDEQVPPKSCVLFLGNKRSGKTSLIYNFIDCREEPKETLALQYFFAAKPRGSVNDKEVCDIWEVGEGCLFTNLLDFVIEPGNISNLVVVICLDLARPTELVVVVERLIESIEKRVEQVLSKCPSSTTLELTKRAVERLNRQVDDRVSKLSLLPVVFVGTKFDMFQEMDSEERKLINRYLRCLSSSLGAALLYTSLKKDSLINRFKLLLQSLTFDMEMERCEIRTDHNKPLFISFVENNPEELVGENIDSLREAVQSFWPQINIERVAGQDPAKESNFEEKDVDLIYSQRGEQLKSYNRMSDIGRRKKF